LIRSAEPENTPSGGLYRDVMFPYPGVSYSREYGLPRIIFKPILIIIKYRDFMYLIKLFDMIYTTCTNTMKQLKIV
jgi:hypothetical protein